MTLQPILGPIFMKINQKMNIPRLRTRTQRIIFDHSNLRKLSGTCFMTFFDTDPDIMKDPPATAEGKFFN